MHAPALSALCVEFGDYHLPPGGRSRGVAHRAECSVLIRIASSSHTRGQVEREHSERLQRLEATLQEERDAQEASEARDAASKQAEVKKLATALQRISAEKAKLKGEQTAVVKKLGEVVKRWAQRSRRCLAMRCEALAG